MLTDRREATGVMMLSLASRLSPSTDMRKATVKPQCDCQPRSLNAFPWMTPLDTSIFVLLWTALDTVTLKQHTKHVLGDNAANLDAVDKHICCDACTSS